MADEKNYTPREVVGAIAKALKEKVEAYAVGVEDLRKREVGVVTKQDFSLCPLCGNADLPGSCICLAKGLPTMPGPIKPPKTPGMQPVTPATPVPGSHGKPAGMVKDEMCATCKKPGALCKCMQKDELPGAAPAAVVPAKPTLPGKKPAVVASPYPQHAKRAQDLSGAIMGIHRDATASEHQSAADAHSLAAKHTKDPKQQQMHVDAARTHQQWATHKTSPKSMGIQPQPTMKSEGLAKNGLQPVTPAPAPMGAPGKVEQIRSNARNRQAMPLADLKSVANPTAPHQAPGLPGMTPALPSMEGFKSVATNPTAMPGGTLTNPPQSAAGVRGTPVAALRARAQRGTPSNQILQHKSAAGIRGK